MNNPRLEETGTPRARKPRFVMCAKLRDVFSPAECARAIEIAESFGLERGVVREADIDAKVRDSRIARFGKTEATSWIYDRIFDVVGPLNRETWLFDLAGAEVLQLASYGVGGHYDWHLDLGVAYPFTMRKISVAVQLSDPQSYDGGDFEALYGMQTDVAPRDLGGMIVFPSYVLHRVTPVTRGTRYSLNAWIHGETPFT